MKFMESTADGTLLNVLQHTVSTALKEWLDDNRTELLRIVREATLDNDRVQPGQKRTRSPEFLTVAEVAQRWQLNPETVRRMIRDGRIPSILAGRHHRVAVVTIEAIETSGSLPRR
jgi:excisionase family DNA binding protein